jgi:hypothetical protein
MAIIGFKGWRFSVCFDKVATEGCNVELAPTAITGRAPKTGLLIRIEEAFLHCGKSLIRSALWDPTRDIDRNILPTYPELY